MRDQGFWRHGKRVSLILLGSFLLAVNINTFVAAGGLIPGGFTGLTLLIQEICRRYGGFALPFAPILVALNLAPAAVCFRTIGKKFVLYSFLCVVASGLMTDFMPAMFIERIVLHDPLLASIFGGLLNAIAITCCLLADATSGGSDFIAIFISERYRKNSWNYIFAGNCVILLVAACLFSLDKALYSIIFQFTTTAALSRFYRGYSQATLFIITNRPKEVYQVIREKTNHDATSFSGTGLYSSSERIMLYSVVASNQVHTVITAIKKIDPASFINVIRTEALNGRFYLKPKD